MSNIENYKNFFHFKSLDEVVNSFSKTILTTNRTCDFFVNWKKVRNNVEKYKFEIGTLSALANSTEFDKDLRRMLSEYPKVAKILPLLIAVRDCKFDILENIETIDVVCLDIKDSLSQDDIEKLIIFAKKTGIEELFKTIKVLHDYLIGVEVGLDTNARKNRSGNFMEKIIETELENAKNKIHFDVLPKKGFKNIAKLHNIIVPNGLLNRTPDFTIKKGEKLISIEVNFYADSGSKPQEIVDSYINRQRELREAGWSFIWITDGKAWIGGTNQLRKAFENMDYVMNLSFVKKGFLEYVIDSL